MMRLVIAGMLSLLVLVTPAFAEKEFTEKDVPPVLKPWVNWVLYDYEKNPCPFLYNNHDDRHCVWPSGLTLDVTAAGAEFTYNVTVYEKNSVVALPGNAEHWPQSVTINGSNGTVIASSGVPVLQLDAGQYTIRGAFLWDEMPEMLPVPEGTGLLNVTINGTAQSQPEVDDAGQLWISRKQVKQQGEEDRLDMKLYRKLTDAIPFLVDTRLVLNVAGKPREAVIGKVLLPEFIPLRVDSTLPARLEPDGTLRMQLKPGTWEVTIAARHDAPANDITLPQAKTPLAAEEIWVVEFATNLRLAKVEPNEQVMTIDPNQTELPAEWRNFSAFRVVPGATLSLKESRRGETEPAADNFTLTRHIWQDFDGVGFTLHDAVNGTVNKDGRLEIDPAITLGRVSVDGVDQFINRLGEKSKAGIEIRQGYLTLEADSRMEKARGTLPATGWQREFKTMTTNLFLAPGWRLLGVEGADSVSRSWVKTWDFPTAFLLIFVTFSIYKLMGRMAGIISGLGLILIHPDFSPLAWYALALIPIIALLRILPEGKLKKLLTVMRIGCILLLLLSTLPFIIDHIRGAIYPQLGGFQNDYDYRSYNSYDGYGRGGGMAGNVEGALNMMAVDKAVMAPAPAQAPMESAERKQRMEYDYKENQSKDEESLMSDTIAQGAANVTALPKKMITQNLYDPNTKVQTGFGVANWRAASGESGISMTGPIQSNATLSLWLLSPLENLLLAFLRVIWLVVIVGILCGMPPKPQLWKERVKTVSRIFALLLFAGLTLLPPDAAHAQDSTAVTAERNAFPPEALLNQLRERLLATLNKKPSCLPECASISRSRLEVTPSALTLYLEIHTGDTISVPLPGGVNNWRPSVVTVDGNPVGNLRVDDSGFLMMELSKGVHQVILSGALPQLRDTVNISYPLTSHHTTASAEGWEVQGIRENGASDSNLQLLRTSKVAAAAGEPTLESTPLPPFLQVERVVTMGISWQVETVVRRLTPLGETVVVEVPLVKGETLTTAGIPVKEGRAFVNLAPQETEKRWSSLLETTDGITLTAPTAGNWAEVWRFSVSNLWHASFSGIPNVRSASEYGGELRSYHPWPGEKVVMEAVRPSGIAGQTITIDRSWLGANPSQRAIDGNVILFIRSSQGGQHPVKLPKGAKLGEVTIDNTPVILQQKDNVVTLPIHPGSQRVDIKWQLPQDISARFEVPAVEVGIASVNAETVVQFPPDRWVLFTTGPRMGPAVLFWGWLPVLILLAVVFHKLQLTPLKLYQWVLLLVGMSQSSFTGIIIVALWLLALGWRQRTPEQFSRNILFNLRQFVLAGLTFCAVSALIGGVFNGLMSSPDMAIAGNGSSAYNFRWYQDIVPALLPQPVVISLPILAYKGLMMLWGFWLTANLIRWFIWGWKCYATGGYWRKVERKEVVEKGEEQS